MKKRRSFTLIEVMVAAFLFAFIVSVLFFWLHFASVEKSRGKKMEAAALELTSADKIMEEALSCISEGDLFFTAEGGDYRPSLLFTFDHGVNRDPLFSGKVVGQLFLDREKKELVFALFPAPEKKTGGKRAQRWVLLNQVTAIEMSFFYPPDQALVSPEKVGGEYPLTGWQDRWKKEFKTLPAMAKIKVTRLNEAKQEEWLTFAYEISHFSNPIKIRK